MPWVALPHPVNKEGFISEEDVFKIAYGTLNLPFGSLDELTPLELYWLAENKEEKDKFNYEMLSYAMKVAFVSANSGKDIPLFKEDKTGSGNTVTPEERENTLSFLDSNFEG